MTTAQTRRFRPIAGPLDADDAALDRVNDQLGVPTMSKPKAERVEPERADVEKLTVELPAYLLDALRREAAERRSTVRHIVMLALREAGFRVDEPDLVADGRRSGRRSRKATLP